MFPYIYQSPGFTLGSYGLMLALAYLAGRYVYVKQLNSITNIKLNTEALVISLLLFGVLGAKIMFIAKNHSISSINWQLVTSESGFSSQGAILAAILVTLVFSKLSRVKLHLLLDNAAPAAILAYGIARLGCFLSGDDCWGANTNLPWGMSFPNGIAPTEKGQYVHPVPIYEILYSGIILLYLNYQKKQQPKPYFIFFNLLLLWGACRFLVEFVGNNPIKLYGMSGSQVGALLMFLTAVIFFFNQQFLIDKKKPGK